MASKFVVVNNDNYQILFLPPEQELSLQVFVSARGIVLAEAHFSPLFDALAIFPLLTSSHNISFLSSLMKLVDRT